VRGNLDSSVLTAITFDFGALSSMNNREGRPEKTSRGGKLLAIIDVMICRFRLTERSICFPASSYQFYDAIRKTKSH
jgi:hypothetical protein